MTGPKNECVKAVEENNEERKVGTTTMKETSLDALKSIYISETDDDPN